MAAPSPPRSAAHDVAAPAHDPPRPPRGLCVQTRAHAPLPLASRAPRRRLRPDHGLRPTVHESRLRVQRRQQDAAPLEGTPQLRRRQRIIRTPGCRSGLYAGGLIRRCRPVCTRILPTKRQRATPGARAAADRPKARAWPRFLGHAPLSETVDDAATEHSPSAAGRRIASGRRTDQRSQRQDPRRSNRDALGWRRCLVAPRSPPTPAASHDRARAVSAPRGPQSCASWSDFSSPCPPPRTPDTREPAFEQIGKRPPDRWSNARRPPSRKSRSQTATRARASWRTAPSAAAPRLGLERSGPRDQLTADSTPAAKPGDRRTDPEPAPDSSDPRR